ncbi:hypothetical protein BUALT_Bualt19G0026900 [Buddleja alternifolia]|uniref:Pectinesterase inhibitor domain-containing protein n=1 Tax=Buddleja alternifolia TaxID=168488 RepID=A0AAV6W6L5_9LAMI|nr:hypothetical protein BUALT_Bualt19G0026900 [Buddleja alternifolia]
MIMKIHATKPYNLINSTCLNSSYNNPNINYTFCTTSLHAAAPATATLHGLGATSVTLIVRNVTDTRRYTKRLMRNKKWDGYTRQCLADCFHLFSDAIPSAKQAMRDYDEERFNDANVEISSTMDAVSTCENGFKEGRGSSLVSPLKKRNEDLFQLSAMALSVMRMIQTGSA